MGLTGRFLVVGLAIVALVGFGYVYVNAQDIDTAYESPDYESMRPEASGFLYGDDALKENSSTMVSFKNTGDIAYNISNMEWKYWTEETEAFVDYEDLPESRKLSSERCGVTELDRDDGILMSGESMDYCLGVNFPFKNEFGVAIYMKRYDSTLYLTCDDSPGIQRRSCGGNIVYNKSEVDLGLNTSAE